MKFFYSFIFLVLFFLGCSKDETITEPITNSSPELSEQVFTVKEDASVGFVVGTIIATDKENSKLSFEFLDKEIPFTLNKSTGQISVSKSGLIDYERTIRYDLIVKVGDGESSSQANIIINVIDVYEPTMSIEERNRLIKLFKFMALKESNTTPNGATKKWETGLKIFVSGRPSDTDKETLTKFIAALNDLSIFNFSISEVNSKEDSNLEIFFETFSELMKLRPDFMPNADSANRGRSLVTTKGNTNVIFTAKIWINKDGYRFSTINHEVFHAIGFGHSDDLDSVLYTPSRSLELSDDDKFIIETLYSEFMQANYDEKQIEDVLLENL